MSDVGGAVFNDIAASPYAAAITALANQGIISGMGGGSFAPTAPMTRAQFAAIISRSLGLAQQMTAVFSDVESNSWYAEYVGAAYAAGIIKGISATTFNPGGNITYQQAAWMVERGGSYLGLTYSVPLNAAEANLPISRAELAEMLYQILLTAGRI